MTYFHPKDTTKLFEKYLKFSPREINANEKNTCEHMAYGLYYASIVKDSNSNNGVYSPNIKRWQVGSKNIENISKVNKALNKLLFETSLQNEIAVLRGETTCEPQNNKYPKKEYEKERAKILVGIGGANVLETNLTIHQIYGAPYIPASSMKGLVRHWAIQAFFNGIDPTIENCPLLNEQQLHIKEVFIALFGDQDQRGNAQFYDVFPTEKYMIVPDVVAIHFDNYYKENGEPSDEGNVLPFSNVQAIEADSFDIRLSVRKNLNGLKILFNSEELLEILKTWTRKMLLEHGIGAKTSNGYGQFFKVNDLTEGLKKEAAAYHAKKVTAFENKKRHKLRIEQEKLAALEEEKIQKRREKMEPYECIIDEIHSFTHSVQDQEKSKNKEFFDEVIKHASEGHKEVAVALQDYWKETGNMKVNKKSKQMDKIKKLKKILDE